jgi:hypothetical protein
MHAIESHFVQILFAGVVPFFFFFFFFDLSGILFYVQHMAFV